MAFISSHMFWFIFPIFFLIWATVMFLTIRGRRKPENMLKLQGRQEMSDDEFHTAFYPDVPKMLVTATRVLFANRAGVPHKLLLPTDRLADFGIQDHANEVMINIQKQPSHDAQMTAPVNRIETLDDIVKLERWAIEQRKQKQPST